MLHSPSLSSYLTQPSLHFQAHLFHSLKGTFSESGEMCSSSVNVKRTPCCTAQQMGQCSPECHQQALLHGRLRHVGQNGEFSNSTKEAANCSNAFGMLNKRRKESENLQHTHTCSCMHHAHTNTHTNIHILACTHARTYTCMHTHTTHTCTWLHRYKRTYTHGRVPFTCTRLTCCAPPHYLNFFFIFFRSCTISGNVGRSSGSYCQHRFMSSCTSMGQPRGHSKR